MALYFFLLSRGSAARTTANFYLIPGTVAVLAWLLLGEPLSPLAVLGFAIAGLGCWLVGRRPTPASPPPRHVWTAPVWQGAFGGDGAGLERSCIRPVDAVG